MLPLAGVLPGIEAAQPRGRISISVLIVRRYQTKRWRPSDVRGFDPQIIHESANRCNVLGPSNRLAQHSTCQVDGKTRI
jgi:hypothetical protein